MEDYQQRVVDEKSELDDMLSKIGTFLAGSKVEALPLAEQRRLARQWQYMRAYSDVLGERIEAWTAP